MNMSESTWKMADILVACLIALVIGALFSWWAGATVFLLGLVIVLRPKAAHSLPLSPEGEGRSIDQEDEWYYYYYRLHHGDKN